MADLYTEKYDVFLSYRRDGGETMAILLRDRLSAKGFRVFLDIESLNSGSFNKALFTVIENCTDIVLVCSKGCLDRCINEGDWVRAEIAHALKHKKNIVPLMLRDFAFPDILPDDIEELRMQNGVNANSHEYFDAAIDRLAEKFLKSTPTPPTEKTQKKTGSKLPKILIGVAASLLLITAIIIGSIAIWGNSGKPPIDDDIPVGKTVSSTEKSTEPTQDNHTDETADTVVSDEHFDTFPPYEPPTDGSLSPDNVYITGSIIEFGGYQWRILHKESGGPALIISEYVLENKDFHIGRGVTWENSDIRNYLNMYFFYETFNEIDRERIVHSYVQNNDNPWFGTYGGEDTYDYIFLLSLEELLFFGNSGQLRDRPMEEWLEFIDGEYVVVGEHPSMYIDDEYNDERMASHINREENMDTTRWWLRTPGYYDDTIVIVLNYGGVSVGGSFADSIYGIRPAMWIWLDDVAWG